MNCITVVTERLLNDENAHETLRFLFSDSVGYWLLDVRIRLRWFSTCPTYRATSYLSTLPYISTAIGSSAARFLMKLCSPFSEIVPIINIYPNYSEISIQQASDSVRYLFT